MYNDIYKNNFYINLLFIERYRTDIYHIRQLFLNLASALLYFKHYKWVFYDTLYPLHSEIDFGIENKNTVKLIS